jgi:hypothetical protein
MDPIPWYNMKTVNKDHVLCDDEVVSANMKEQIRITMDSFAGSTYITPMYTKAS